LPAACSTALARAQPAYCVAKVKIMMKRASVLTVLVVFLSMMLLYCTGCAFFSQPGETAAAGHRRHIDTLRVNNQEMMKDIDQVLLLDRPSKLTEMRVP